MSKSRGSEPKVKAATPEREAALVAFLETAGQANATRSHLSGDASHRRYERLVSPDGKCTVLMDDPTDPADTQLGDAQKSYGQIAHLSFDMRAFVAIGNRLRAEGLSAPEVLAYDFNNGFLIIEDLGDDLFAALINADEEPLAREAALYGGATEALLHHHAHDQPVSLPLPGGGTYELPRYDPPALQIEVDLLLDWYAPAQLGKTLDDAARDSFRAIWAPLFPLLESARDVLILRDFHSPNLLLLEERKGVEQIGIIDYQDGLMGHPCYDLMSMLQDARRDVPASLEAKLMERYLEARPELDSEAFRAAYAIFGAQRASKIIGIFCRLWKRDGKDNYLVHLPRMWVYLERNLTHPALAEYKAWIDEHFPQDRRER